jgi:hypothetical protein
MQNANFVRKEIQEMENIFSIVLVKTKNADIALLSEGEDRLGTLAVALPQKSGMIGHMMSSTLLGEKNSTLARVLAEHLAKVLKRMVLVSVFVKTMDEQQVGRIFLKLIENALPETKRSI